MRSHLLLPASILASFVLNARPLEAQAAKAGERAAKIALAPCRLEHWNEDVLCGEFEVFEDRAARAGRKLTLKLVVLPARKKPAAPDAVFYLAGGPGGSAIDAASRSGPTFLAYLRDEHDVVLVDQRGTGGSHPLPCDVHTGSDMSAWFGEIFPSEQVKAGRDELAKDADLTRYTTDIAMDDLDDVRAALGYETIDLYGGSYGSRAALVYLRRHEAHVRTATLLGVAPPEVKLPLPFAHGFDSALTVLARDCAADARAHAAFPDPLADLDAALRRLDAGTLEVATGDPFTGQAATVRLTRTTFVELVRTMLYQPESARWLPYLFHQCAQGDFGALVSVGYNVRRQIEELIARGMHFSVVCAEDVAFLTEAEIAREMTGTRYGDARARAYQSVAALWPLAKLDASHLAPVESRVPVLLISGEADPVTPPQYAEAALAHLARGRHVVVPHTGHAFAYPCVDRLVADFVRAGAADGLDVSCLAGVERPPFVTPDEVAAEAGAAATKSTPAEHEEWKGLLDVGAAKLHVVLKVWRTGDGYHGALDSPDQGASDLAIDALTWEEKRLHFEMRSLTASYDGTLADDGKSVHGEWRQGGRSWTLDLTRSND